MALGELRATDHAPDGAERDWVCASTGTKLYGALRIIADMIAHGRAGSVVSMIRDPGERFAETRVFGQA